MQYILQTILFQLIFLLVYEFFLRKETFFNWNRAYLLITSILSFVLPFVKIQAFSKVVPQEYVFQLPTVVIGEVTQEELLPVTTSQLSEVSTGFQWQWEYLLWIGIVFSLVLLLTKIAKIIDIIRNNKVLKHSNISLVQLKNSNAAFSFFNYVFIGENIEEKEQDIILKHELVHVQQKHSLDLLFFEILRVLFWYNPLIYIYQSKLRVLHEFIADQEALKTQDKATYYQNLLAQIFDTQNVSFINTFYKKSLIKKRIIMLQKSKSSQLNLAKYLVILPLLFMMLAYNAAFAQEHPKSEAAYKELSDEQLRETLYEELVEKENEGENLFALRHYLPTFSDRYINSRVEYYRFSVYMDRIMEKRLESHPEDIDMVKHILNENKQTYDEYLAYKKTQESKDKWEAGMSDGKVRMFVENVDNLTKAEENKKQNNIKMIEKDEYYHSLILADENNKLEKIVVNKQRHDKKRDELLGVQTEFESVEVPFAVIDQIPLSSECKDLPKEEQRKCFSNDVSKHVASNFNTKLANDLGLTGRQRINVIFKINKEGDVTGIRARAPHPALEEEAKRVIATLPKMIPGQHKGKTVIVPYALPIVFQIAEKEEAKTPKDKLDYVPFAVVDQIPLFEECKTFSKDEQKQCFVKTMEAYITNNMNTKLANEAGLTGKLRVYVLFKIDTNGEVTGIKAGSSSEILNKEAERVVASLPKMIPGQHNGKPVKVAYSLPVLLDLGDSKNKE